MKPSQLSAKFRKILYGLYLLGIFAGLIMHAERWVQESKNKTVEVVLDYNAISELARNESVPLEQKLGNFTIEGVKPSLAFSELRQDELDNRGIAEVYTAMQLSMTDIAMPGRPDMAKSYLLVFQPAQVEPLMASLQTSLGKGKVRIWKPGGVAKRAGLDWNAVAILEIDVSPRSLGNLGFGFPVDDIKALEAKGYRVWLRPENKPQAGDEAVKAQLEPLKALNPQGLIFGGSANEAVGYPDALNTTVDILRENHWKLGLIESDKKTQQKGIEGIIRSKGMAEQTVRVFAIAPAHLATLKPDRASQMLSLAGRERNIRVLYVRPYPYMPNPDKDFVGANEVLMKDVRKDLAGRFGPASEFKEPVKANAATLPLMAAGSWAVTWLMLDLVTAVPSVPMFALGAMLVILTELTLLSPSVGQLWRSLMALGTATAASLFSMISQFDNVDRAADQRSGWKVLRSSLSIWLQMSMWSLLGAWLASSYLQETSFKLGLDVFRGVKLVTVGVPVLATLAWVTRRRGLAPIREFMQMPLRFYHLISFVVLSAVGVIYTLRTGNMSADMGGEALEYEKYVRVLLDQVLFVRPRFKEFLLAHPAMILLPMVIWMGGRSVAWLFLLAGALGQCGLDDTFAHIHTPLQISIARTIMGIVLGAAVGSMLSAGLIWWRERGERLRARNSLLGID